MSLSKSASQNLASNWRSDLLVSSMTYRRVLKIMPRIDFIVQTDGSQWWRGRDCKQADSGHGSNLLTCLDFRKGNFNKLPRTLLTAILQHLPYLMLIRFQWKIRFWHTANIILSLEHYIVMLLIKWSKVLKKIILDSHLLWDYRVGHPFV